MAEMKQVIQWARNYIVITYKLVLIVILLICGRHICIEKKFKCEIATSVLQYWKGTNCPILYRLATSGPVNDKRAGKHTEINQLHLLFNVYCDLHFVVYTVVDHIVPTF